MTAQIMMQYIPVPVNISLSGPNIFLSNLFWVTLGLRTFVDTEIQVTYLHKATDKAMFLYPAVFILYMPNVKTDAALNDSRLSLELVCS
jgi:hypothetical protein